MSIPRRIKKPVDGTGPGSDAPFTYKFTTGIEVTVPSMSKIFRNAGEMRRNRNMTPVDLMWWVLERETTDEQLATFDDIEMDEFNEFTDAWMVHSGATPGE